MNSIGYRFNHFKVYSSMALSRFPSLPLLLFFFFFVFFRATPAAYGGSQDRGLMGAVATGLRHSHSNMGSELPLRPTPQLTAMLDP